MYKKPKKKISVIESLRSMEPGEVLSFPLTVNYSTIQNSISLLRKKGAVMKFSKTDNFYKVERL